MVKDIIIGRDEADKKKFGDKGLIYIGKHYVKMGQTTSLSGRIMLDVARAHVILVAGKRGSGKCLTGDTLIQLADGRLIPIKELRRENKVMALNEELKIEGTKKEGLFKRKADKILKIKLRSGKEIKLTPEHPLLTIKGWAPAKNLKKGDRIATPRRINAFGNKDLKEWEVKLLAYLIAEGHTKKVVLFSNSDKKIVEDFKACVKKLDSKLKVVEDRKGHFRVIEKGFRNRVLEANLKRDAEGKFVKGTRVEFRKRSIRKFIEKYSLFNKLATEKEIPQAILQLKKKKLALFLNRLFSCDGSIYKKITHSAELWQISYCSSSEQLIRQVQNLLLRFGIVAKLRKKRISKSKFVSYELIINPQFIEQFSKEIGFFGEKAKKLKIAVEKTKNKKRNPNVDLIPKEVWELYRNLPKGLKKVINYSPSRETLLKIAELENNEFLKKLATSDIFWDEIEEITLIRGEFEVYDFAVPNHHNFIANDLIVHNSYTLGVLAEEISSAPPEVSQNIAVIIFDTMGIYWTMKYKNEKEEELLKEWGLEAKAVPVKVFVPAGYAEKWREKGIPVDKEFTLKVSEITADDWLLTFNLSFIDPVGIVISRNVIALQERKEKEGRDYDLDDIIEAIKQDEEASKENKDAAINLFEGAKSWGVFATKDQEGTTIRDLVVPGTTTVLDLSCYPSVGVVNVRALVIGLLCKKLFTERMAIRKHEEIEAIRHGADYLHYKEKREMPLVWLFIDEGHEFLPLHGKTAATDALIQVLREGRQPGIALALATQQPGQIHRDVMTQSDIVISHRVTAKPDIDALNYIMQTYLLADLKKYLDELPRLKGSAIILDDNSERIYPMRVHPRFTWHGGETPTAVKVKARL